MSEESHVTLTAVQGSVSFLKRTCSQLQHDQYRVSVKHWTDQPIRLHKDAALKRTKRSVHPILTSKVTRW